MKEDRIIEIARFYEPEKAQMLESLLKSEGINCYLRNEYSSQVMYPADMGGIRVELLESDAPRALAIMQANGYSDEKADKAPAATGWGRHIPLLNGLSPKKRWAVLLVVFLIWIYLLVFCAQLIISL